MARPAARVLAPAGGPATLDAVEPVRVETAHVDQRLIGLALVVGAVLRVAVLVSPLGRADSDEVVAGLMARHLGSDGFPLFFWGQHYGGTIELWPIALSQWLFGPSVLALRLPTIVLAVVSSVLVWRVARRLLSCRLAASAGLLTWLGPPAAVWFGVREQLFYQPTVVLGLVTALLVLGDLARPSAWRLPLAGFVAGVGVWTSFYVAYYLVPLAVAAVPRLWRAMRRGVGPRASTLVLTAMTAVLGLTPLAVDLIAQRGAPLRVTDAFPVVGTYWSRFGWYFTHGFPAGLGLRETFTLHWLGGGFGVVAYVIVLAVVVRGVWLGLRVWSWDALGLVLFPFVFAAVPFGTQQPNLRYQFFVVPFVALVLSRAMTRRGPELPPVVALLSIMATLSVVGLTRMADLSADEPFYRIGHVGDLGPAERVLEQRGITHAFADYWIAFRISYETDERIMVAPSSGSDRYHSYLAWAWVEERSAWIVQQGAQLNALRGALEARGIRYEVVAAGDVAVVLPDRPVMPEDLPPAARTAVTA